MLLLWLQTHLWGAGLTTVTPCLGVYLLPTYTSYNAFKTVWPELSHTTPLRKALHWLPIRHRCIFKTALLVYKYLHTNCPKYFSPFLKVRQCAYNTRLSQSDGIILHVPQYQPSIYTSTKQFSLSFAYDAPKIWNELPDDVRSATSIASFRKNLRHTCSAKLILLSIFHLIWRSP